MNPIVQLEVEPGERLKFLTDAEVPGIRPMSYAISTYGNVYSVIKRGESLYRRMVPNSDRDGKMYINFSTIYHRPKTEKIYRLVLKAFKPRPDMFTNKNLQVKFIDGNYTNNHVDNLEWREGTRYNDPSSFGDPSKILSLLQYGEKMLPITDDIVPGIKPYYYATNFGRVFSISGYHNDKIHEVISYTNPASNGYYNINLYLRNGKMKRCSLHRVILATFKPIPGWQSFDVNHLKGKMNNWVDRPMTDPITGNVYLDDSIVWATSYENNIHALQTGLRKRTDKDKIIEAKTLLNNGMRTIDVASRLGLSYDIVYTIKHETRYLDILKEMEDRNAEREYNKT